MHHIYIIQRIIHHRYHTSHLSQSTSYVMYFIIFIRRSMYHTSHHITLLTHLLHSQITVYIKVISYSFDKINFATVQSYWQNLYIVVLITICTTVQCIKVYVQFFITIISGPRALFCIGTKGHVPTNFGKERIVPTNILIYYLI
jgi:hypothetical protein